MPRCYGDNDLLASLVWFMPPLRKPGSSGIAFNMRTVVRARSGLTHLPAYPAGIPYTGPGRSDMASARQDHCQKLVRDAGMLTPNFCVIVAAPECRRAAIPPRKQAAFSIRVDGVSLHQNSLSAQKMAANFRSASPSRQR